MFQTVPVEFLRLIEKSVDITDTYPATQMPEFDLVVIPCRICLDITLGMELLIELFEEHPFLEGPSRGLAHCIDIPTLCDNLVFDDAGVTDQRVNPVGGHHRGRVPVVDSRRSVFLHFRACANEEVRIKN